MKLITISLSKRVITTMELIKFRRKRIFQNIIHLKKKRTKKC